MTFAQLSQRLSQIESVSGRLEMTQSLAEIFHACSPEEAQIISYLMLGQLRPAYYGTQFNIARKGMEQVVAHVLNQSLEQVQERLRELGDLGSVVAEGAWQVTEEQGIVQVYDTLVTFERITGAGSQHEKAEYLRGVLLSVTPQEAQYIVRIILSKLRLGFSEMTIIEALSWYVAEDKSYKDDIEYAYNRCADIGKISYAIVSHGISGLEQIDIQVGIPVRMAAAERLPSLQAIVDRLGTCVVQPKLDGFRLQVHIATYNGKQHMSFFSRNLADMSHMFPDVHEALEHMRVSSVIIEGEAIAYDESTGSYLPFQETVKRRRKYDIQEAMQAYPLYFMIFDILYYEGESVLHKPHTQRRELLRELCDNYPDTRVQLVQERHIGTEQELQAYFQHAITQGLEGVIVRRPDAAYQPGKRNYNWIKFKRRQANALEDTIDCVILGYYYGHGRRAHFGIGAFLVGVYNEANEQFETIAKVGTGLTDAGWQELKRVCDENVIQKIPNNVRCHQDLIPDVIVDPQIVVDIAADEITQSPLHTAGQTDDIAGLALRFPRHIDYRWDKQPTQATTVEEVRTLYQHQ